MAPRVAQFYGLIFVWHALRHFNSYALLGSQSYFDNPLPEWLLLGFLEVLVGGLLLWKPNPWFLVAAAVILFLRGVAYPVVLHIGDSVFIVLLLGLATVQLGGDAWLPLATAPSTFGVALAGLWKLQGGQFSVHDLTDLVLLRYPWMDGLHVAINQYTTLTTLMSDLVIGIELAAPCIWLLLFFPRLWRWRSLLALLPISLLFGIGITGNLDEFPWIMLTVWLLMLGPKPLQSKTPIRPVVYPLVFILCAASVLSLGINLQSIYSSEADSFFNRPVGILPDNRAGNMALFVLAPCWAMYSAPIVHDQMFGGETSRILKLEPRIKSGQGCGLALDRWERIYWERIREALRDSNQQATALMLRSRYKSLEKRPCSIIVLPPPSQAAPP